MSDSEDRVRTKGPVIAGRLDGSDQNSFIPFSKNSGDKPVIATEQFAVPKAGYNLIDTLRLNKVSEKAKVQISIANSGQGNKTAPMDLGSASQYLLIGGREYNVGPYRGIGMGYIGNPSEIAPVFVGIQEVGPDDHTNADFIVATRASQKNVAPDVKFRVKTDGQIITSDDYTPKSSQALVNKQYLDTIVDELQAQIDALKSK